jgi:hypothetical protein
MINELWRPLPEDIDEMFAVSNHGRVQNMMTGDILEPFLFTMDGYPRVAINSGWVPIHLLVAEAFICCLDCDFWEVVHKDGDKTNNMIWNLDLKIAYDEWEYWRNDCE